MMFLAFLFAILPAPSPRLKVVYISGYAQAYYSLQKKVAAWHKRELEKLDFEFAELQGSLNLMRARDVAISQGIGPMDPDYPDILDYSPSWKRVRDRTP
jgi:hypothetical protein